MSAQTVALNTIPLCLVTPACQCPPIYVHINVHINVHIYVHIPTYTCQGCWYQSCTGIAIMTVWAPDTSWQMHGTRKGTWSGITTMTVNGTRTGTETTIVTVIMIVTTNVTKRGERDRDRDGESEREQDCDCDCDCDYKKDRDHGSQYHCRYENDTH